MATITDDRFDPIKAFCNVRLQQGVPLVDADVNELDDIRKFEVRAFLKWFVGNGIPDGNDGFRIDAIDATGATDDFTISAGVRPATTTSQSFQQPDNGSIVNVAVASTAWMAIGQHISIIQPDNTFGGFYQVSQIGKNQTSVRLTKQSSGGGIPSGTIMATAAKVFASCATNVDKALFNFGRCIVDGLDVIIERDITYKKQPLFLAANYGVPQVAPLPLPLTNNLVGPWLAYLDIWERTVYATEDTNLIVPPLGTESCARLKREWVVRTRRGTSVPVQGDPDFLANHLYYGLAVINRRVGASIQKSDITDQREKNLQLLPSTLIPDVLGGTASDYRKGLNRPAMSLRDTINALLHGEAPSTAERLVTSTSGVDSLSNMAFFDGANGIVVTWREASNSQIFGARLDLANLGAGFSAKEQLTSEQMPSTIYGAWNAVALPNGDLLLVYGVLSTTTDNLDIYYKRASTIAAFFDPATLAVPVAATAVLAEMNPVAVVAGKYVVFFYSRQSVSSSADEWVYRRLDHTTNKFLEPTTTTIAGESGDWTSLHSGGGLHAVVDNQGMVWAAYTQEKGVVAFCLTAATDNVIEHPGHFNSKPNTSFYDPFVVVVGVEVWLFWAGPLGIMFGYYREGYWSGEGTPVPGTVAGDRRPKAVLDGTGHLAVVFDRITVDPSSEEMGTFGSTLVVYVNIATRGYGLPLVANSFNARPQNLGVLAGSNKALWLFWSRAFEDLYNTITYKQVFSAI